MRTATALLFFIISLSGMAQEQLNDYKYIIIPKKFEDFKRKNQYQTSTLVKYLFTEKGFDAVYEDELPQELKNNGCLGLRAKLVDGSSLFTTKTTLALENCNGQEVFTTKEGKSKEKDYKDSYGEALRDAFTSFETINYSYNGKAENSSPVTANMENDVKKMDEEKPQSHTSVNRPDEMVEQEATRENQKYRDRRPVASDFKKAEPKDDMANQGTAPGPGPQNDQDRYRATLDKKQGTASDLSTIATATLYAQELANGFQLVDSTPKIRMKIQKSSMPDFYLAEAGNTKGVVFQKNGTWLFEYYSDDKLVTEELDIKF